jgi:hypothetical protein
LTPHAPALRIDRSGPVAQLGARFHGMEEVIGSIPIRSTNYFNNLADSPPNGWQQIGSKFQTAVQPLHVSRLHLLSEAPRFG